MSSSSRRRRHPPPHPQVNLRIQTVEAPGQHQRTVFVLATPGSHSGELGAILDTKFNGHTIRSQDTDTKFVQLSPPGWDGGPAPQERRSRPWFSDAQLYRFANNFMCSTIPDLAPILQAVINVVVHENRVVGIPLCNIVIAGTDQASVVAMGVVLALGVDTIRYIGIDCRVPLLARLTVLRSMATATATEPAQRLRGLAIFFRWQLQLVVPDPLPPAPSGKTKGGLVTMLFLEGDASAHGFQTHIGALQLLQDLGFCARVRVAPEQTDLSRDRRMLRALIVCIAENLEFMGIDDGQLDCIETGRFMITSASPQALQHNPVEHCEEPPKPFDLLGDAYYETVEVEADNGEAYDETDDQEDSGESETDDVQEDDSESYCETDDQEDDSEAYYETDDQEDDSEAYYETDDDQENNSVSDTVMQSIEYDDPPDER